MIARRQNFMKSEKIYMTVVFVLLSAILVFKLSYINREYFGADYSVYALLFLPLFIYKVLDGMSSPSARTAFTWICAVPMSIYLYRKQYDVLITYSAVGMLTVFFTMKKDGKDVIKFIYGASAYLMLGIASLCGVIGRYVTGSINDEYMSVLAHNIIKNAEMFGASEALNGYCDILNSGVMRMDAKYFMAANIVKHGIVPVLSIALLIIAALCAAVFILHKKGRDISVAAACTLAVQVLCYILLNTGILGSSVYEMVFYHGNRIYSACEVILLCITLWGFRRG